MDTKEGDRHIINTHSDSPIIYKPKPKKKNYVFQLV